MLTVLTVLTWNVRHLRDDAHAVASVLRALDPDVVCLQEAPRSLRWRSRLSALARESGLLYAGGGRTAGDSALLAHLRVDVLETHEMRLPRRPRLHQRGLALAVVRCAGAQVAVGSVHLGLDADERVSHAAELLRIFGTLGPLPAVLGGDFNEPPGAPAWSVLSRRFRDAAHEVGSPSAQAPTFPARRPRSRIDAVLVDEGVAVDDCGVPALPPGCPPYDRASDHLPVLARLRVARS